MIITNDKEDKTKQTSGQSKRRRITILLLLYISGLSRNGRRVLYTHTLDLRKHSENHAATEEEEKKKGNNDSYYIEYRTRVLSLCVCVHAGVHWSTSHYFLGFNRERTNCVSTTLAVVGLCCFFLSFTFLILNFLLDWFLRDSSNKWTSKKYLKEKTKQQQRKAFACLDLRNVQTGGEYIHTHMAV